MYSDFYIVGKRDCDCYIIYDAREGMGGKCCVSRYTIAQLLDAGYTICGVKRQKNTKTLSVSDIQVVNLSGNPANRNSAFDNIPDTKRSASTVSMGLKKSKEEVARNKEIGQKRSETIHENKAKNRDNIEMFELYQLVIAGLNRLTLNRVAKIYNYQKKDEERVNDFEQLYYSNGKEMPVYYSKSKDITVSARKIREKFEKIGASFSLKDGKYLNSSVMRKYGATPLPLCQAVIANTNKKILYTYGLRYRHPSTMDAPISKEKALAILERGGFIDVDENENAISITEYSTNDMW